MLRLTSSDRELLAGKRGEAAQFAMQTLVEIGEAFGAQRFVEIESAHVASAYCHTQTNRDFAAQLVAWNTRVAVPTTLTACSINTQEPKREEPDAAALIDAYTQMGCEPLLSCAPYASRREPGFGTHVAWCESSAVVYANSVLGARTNCYPEFVDMCAAITGRVPECGFHSDANRRATVLIELQGVRDDWFGDTWFFEALGIFIGEQVGNAVPVIVGLPDTTNRAQLRALGSAAASSGSVGLFHALGITSEAPDLEAATQGSSPDRYFSTGARDIEAVAAGLSTNCDEPVTAICVGAPHLTYDELVSLADLFDGRRARLPFFAATSGAVLAELETRGKLEDLRQNNVRLVTGRCTYYKPLVAELGSHVMTNSAKWAWYAPGNLDVAVTFASLADCIAKACDD